MDKMDKLFVLFFGCLHKVSYEQTDPVSLPGMLWFVTTSHTDTINEMSAGFMQCELGSSSEIIIQCFLTFRCSIHFHYFMTKGT